jgi:hypothetical protein
MLTSAEYAALEATHELRHGGFCLHLDHESRHSGQVLDVSTLTEHARSTPHTGAPQHADQSITEFHPSAPSPIPGNLI